MAVVARELYASNDDTRDDIRMAAEATVIADFAPTNPAVTYVRGHPVAYNSATGLWVTWTNGGANGTGTIIGFLMNSLTTLLTTGDVQEHVMVHGRIHRDDVPIPSGESQANLDTALKTGLVARGIIVQGIVNVN